MVHNLSIQAQIAGSNSVSALVFGDPKTAESTLSALQASPNIVSAGVYTLDGQPFASYFRADERQTFTLPRLARDQDEIHWFANGQLVVVRRIVFEQTTGFVYIRYRSARNQQTAEAFRGNQHRVTHIFDCRTIGLISIPTRSDETDRTFGGVGANCFP